MGRRVFKEEKNPSSEIFLITLTDITRHHFTVHTFNFLQIYWHWQYGHDRRPIHCIHIIIIRWNNPTFTQLPPTTAMLSKHCFHYTTNCVLNELILFNEARIKGMCRSDKYCSVINFIPICTLILFVQIK